MRPVISYDDITPTQPGTAFQVGPQAPSGHPPLAKKRRTNQRPANGRQQYSQHWDDPGNQAQRMSYDEGVGMAGDDLENGEEGEESRELTHEEIWDDSVLVNAWDSAMAEYKAFHGSDGKWKEEPVTKSPLWYNVPPSENKTKAKGKAKASTSTSTPAYGAQNYQADAESEADSGPIDFETFVPSHDPSLAAAMSAVPGASALWESPGSFVSQDEAFSRALSAMYWGGYYTAIYHYHRNLGAGTCVGEETGEPDREGNEAQGERQGDEADEELLPTQR
ncbi:hypothetical protein IEO21_02722 [Rhodonia placenta]|uniref:Survival Motor Neuron Gemin2-binding domain-containing protein n=1 Tax=Rhodonia placenta TaxID=104341 RepID=A0A8H7P741_9APHY|nr:hypothetical protein IEO21_02722 [Postia placenta]